MSLYKYMVFILNSLAAQVVVRYLYLCLLNAIGFMFSEGVFQEKSLLFKHTDVKTSLFTPQ